MELADFSLENLVTLLLANSISVDNEVRRHDSLLTFEHQDSLLNQVFHLVFHKLLTLGLHDVVRIVLTHGLVSAGSESDHTRLTCMAHIDSDKHRLELSDYLRELHREQVASNFAIHLSDDV